MIASVAAIVLDVVIALYGIALIVILTTGGLDFGWLTLREAAKPILVLWILTPIRLALTHRPLLFGAIAGVRTVVEPVLQPWVARVPASVRDACFAYIVTRLALIAVGFLVNVLFTSRATRPFGMPFAWSKLAETFVAWDSGWYFDIAHRGYYYSPDGQSSIAFFPLYPMAMRAVASLAGGSEAAVWIAGIVVSNVAFLVGLIALHRFAERATGQREVARRTVLYVAMFPFSFFLTSVYPGALFFLLAVLAVSAADRSRWWVAGVWGALATLTRPHGVLILVPLSLMAARGLVTAQGWRRLIALAPVPLALVGYSLYVDRLAGHPLAWLTAQNQWGFSIGHPPWEQLLGLVARLERYGPYDYFFTSEFAAFRLFHGAAAGFFVAMTPAVFARLGAPLGAWVLASLLVALSGNALEGIGRYGAAFFPVFIVLATVRSPVRHETVLIVWSLFLALFVGLFATWQPIY